jgi:protein required for attachment to host cells
LTRIIAARRGFGSLVAALVVEADMRRHEVWALVMDDRTARIVIDVTRPEHMAPDPGEILMENTHRRFSPMGAGQTEHWPAPPGTAERSEDSETAAGHRFAVDVVQALTASYHAGLFERLVVVAGSDMLAILRGALTDDLRACITAEISKQLTAIERHDLRIAITHWVLRLKPD